MRWAPVFAATVKVTDPLPLPIAPDVIVSHAGLLVLLTAVHAQPGHRRDGDGRACPPCRADRLIRRRDHVRAGVARRPASP